MVRILYYYISIYGIYLYIWSRDQPERAKMISLGVIFILFVQTTRFKWTLQATKNSLILDSKKDDLMN